MFRKPRSLLIRIWHWTNALLVIGLLLTVLLRKTLMSSRQNAALFQAKMQELGTSLTDEQAKALGRIGRERLWEWHEWMGYALCAALVIRVISFFLDRGQKDPRRASSLQFRLVKWSHRAFYFALCLMCGSGMALIFENQLPFSKGWKELVSETHENAMWFVLAFLVLHVAGVVKADRGPDKGLISEMVNGG